MPAAHATAAMPVAAALGLGSVACDCLTALVLNLNGNAITLSTDLWKRGVRDGKTLRDEIVRSRREKIYTFGVVFSFSSHRHLLRRWFAAQGIDPERDVRIVVVPPRSHGPWRWCAPAGFARNRPKSASPWVAKYSAPIFLSRR